MAQLDAITGGVMKRRPALTRRNEIEAQAPYIPSMIRAREDREYNDKVLAETQRQNEIVNQMRQAEYDDAKDANKTANKFRTADMVLGGVGMLNEATDGGVVDFGKKALDYVIPDAGATDSVVPEIAKGYSTWGEGASYPDESEVGNFGFDDLWGGIKKVGSAITPDPLENVVKKAFDPATWTGEDGIWSDVSGFVDDIIDFDFDIPFI
jgi:hypothetical protein